MSAQNVVGGVPTNSPPLVPSDVPGELWIEVALELDALDVLALSQVGSLSDVHAIADDQPFGYPGVQASPWHSLREGDLDQSPPGHMPTTRCVLRYPSDRRNESSPDPARCHETPALATARAEESGSP